jgi:hypothetical protein
LTQTASRSYDTTMHPVAKRSVNLTLGLALLFSIACTPPGPKPDVIPATVKPNPAHSRKMQTPPYEGGGAVIFVLDQIDVSRPGDAVNQVIRVFAKNDAALNVALRPPDLANDGNAYTRELSYFSDAGIIDTDIDGHSITWMSPGTSPGSPEYKMFTAGLVKTRDQLKYLFGSPIFACLVPPAAINEVNYGAIQDSGLKVICYYDTDALQPSIKPVSWSGRLDAGGLYRLPIVGKIDFSQNSDTSVELLAAAKQSINNLGVAVIEIPITSVLDGNNKPDPTRLLQLSELIKPFHQLGTITTLESWYRYITGCPPESAGIKRPLPPYNGGPVIVFRLDDVAKGYREEVVQEIIKLFQRNGVPLDCGVVANANGTESYEIPWLKKYVDENAVSISVHGYDWTFYQLDISKNYLLQIENTPCIDVNTARAEAEKAKVSYEELKFKLVQARCKYLKYFGINPVSFTVPTDFYDELGYKAIQDAGYKVFSVHRSLETCPSIDPVDYNCRTDLAKGMYRIPTASDVCVWYNCKWTDVINLDKPMKQKDYCIYIDAFGESQEYNDDGITICSTMTALGVAAVSLHPDCFIDKDGKPDMAKLEKVDAIIKWIKSFATIMTFEQWYRYRIGDK